MASSTALPLASHSSRASSSTPNHNNRRRFADFARIIRKDRDFIKERLHWVRNIQFPVLSKSLQDAFWLRTLEDSHAQSPAPAQWPTPSYPGLSGMDLLMADLKALKAYALYFYYASKIWSTPLPENYDPQKVADYFSRRPHVLAVRVVEVFSSFAAAAVKVRTSGMLKNIFDKHRDDSRSSEYYFGHLLKETMLNLGPTFIKVGQSISTRPDIIGSEVAKALSELHDQIPPFPRTVAMEIIEEELGCPVESVFSNISDKPVAAASFGQVYCGVTFDGHTVAIKVQRPNLLHAVVRDIFILRLGLGLLQKVAKRKSDLRLYADELGKGLVGELDYTLEAANASEFSEAHANFPFIYVPKVYRHLSRKRILTMEWVVGENPNDLLFQSQGSGHHGVGHSERQHVEAKKHLLDLVNKGVEATLVQLLETGILHADPHPGNLLYTPEGQIGFLDFGLLCRMEKKHQLAMLASIMHIVNGDWAALVNDLTEMDVARPGTNLRLVTMELEDALGEVVFKDGIPDIKFSRVLGKIWTVAFKYHFRMPPYYTLVLRSLASLEGLAVAADRDFKTFQAAYPYVVRKLLTDNSVAMRRILHSVVFNKQKEFQWKKLALFLRIGATRKSMQQLLMSNSDGSLEHNANGPNSVFQVANLVMRLLSSKDGVVLRRLLMTADSISLVRAMVSKEATVYHQHVRRALSNVLHQWMIKVFGMEGKITSYISHMTMANIQHGDIGPSSESSAFLFQVVLRDRRVKVILYKVLSSMRNDPILTLKFCWTSFVIFVSASVLAFRQFVISWSKTYLTSVSIAPRKLAVSV